MRRLGLFSRFDARTRLLRLHEVIRTVIARRLGDRLPDVHAKLVGEWGDPRCLPDDYSWKNLLHHLREAGRRDEALMLLFDFDWVHSKLTAAGPVPLIADYQSEPSNEECSRLAAALTLAGASLSDPAQLSAQLVGRLGHLEGTSEMAERLLSGARSYEGAPALLPVRVSLPSIAQGVHRTIRVGAPILSAAVSADGMHLLVGLAQGAVQVWDWRRRERVAAFECHVGSPIQLEIRGDRLAVGGYHDHWMNRAAPKGPIEVWNWRSPQQLYQVAADVEDAREGFSTALRDGIAAMTTGENNNLAADPVAAKDTLLAMNAKLDRLTEREIGVDDGSFLPGPGFLWRGD